MLVRQPCTAVADEGAVNDLLRWRSPTWKAVPSVSTSGANGVKDQVLHRTGPGDRGGLSAEDPRSAGGVADRASVAAVAPDLLMLTMIIGFPAIDSGLFFAEI
jgi:hypothetical protein